MTVSPGDVLTAAEWNAEVAKKPGCRIYNSVNGNPSNNTQTAHSFDSESYDDDTMHESVTHPTRITINTAGKYTVGGCVEFAFNATGQRQVGIRLNGTTTIVSDKRNACATGTTQIPVSTEYKFAANDYIELMVFQDSGGALNTDANDFSPVFWARWQAEN